MSKEQTRKLMPPDMLAFADEIRDKFDARMTYLKVGDIEFGTPPERGICVGDMVLLDWERKQAEKAKKGGRRG